MILRSCPVFSPRPWGDRKLNRIYGVDSEEPIGEVWLLSDIEGMRTWLESGSTRLSPNEVIDKLSGRSLPRFPIMVKHICASEWLSVQVHPDDKFARLYEGEPWGKSECWYFLNEGQVLAGMKNKTKPVDSVREDDLNHILLKRGDLLALPAGIVHAIGPGSELIEIQQNSDVTYRLYDWDRGRELHIEKASKAVNPSLMPGHYESVKRFDWEYFSVRETSRFSGTGVCVTIEEKPSLYLVIDDAMESAKPFLAITLGEFWSEIP